MAQNVVTTHRRRGGVTVKHVAPDSLASDCGIEAGDVVWSINGHIIPDSLSFTFNISNPELTLELLKPDGEMWELEVDNDPDASFGIDLEDDPIMLCRNKCIFCFVDQNPKGYRRSLLIKDEDIRLSFMYGNYSTLSSTDTAEEDRIIREKISPLYVSVHATDPETRVFMLKNKRSGNIMQRLRKFAEHGIDFHAQIVLCPDVNDGDVLRKTIEELSSLHPACLSIAVVPLGITKHRAGLTQLKPVDDTYCADTIAFCRPYQAGFRQTVGHSMIYLGDEFYLRAGEPIPSRADYGDFPQMENGIGMVRRFTDAFFRAKPWSQVPSDLDGTLVTGSLFGPVLTDCIRQLNETRGTKLKVAAVDNHAFGADLINVAGLVHGKDILDHLSEQDVGSFVLLPHVMLKDPVEDPLLIDDHTPRGLARSLGVPVVGSGNRAQDLLMALQDWPQHLLAKVPAARRAKLRTKKVVENPVVSGA